MARRLLYVDANTLIAYTWRGGALAGEGVFPADEGGLAAFARYLEAHRRDVFHLLADLADEGFHPEAVPHVHGRDRNAMLSRKLAQFFYGASFAAALSQGREKGGRHDERILFTALTRSQALDPWLALLHRCEAALAGVWSVPMVSRPLLQQLGVIGERVLLVHVTHAGIRQTYFEHGQLRFSRLTPLAAPGTHLGAACAAECARIYQYLVSQRIVSRGTRLPVLVLVHPSRLAQFRDDCQSGEELQYTLVDLHFACRQTGLTTVPPDIQSETLFLHLMMRHPHKTQLAPAAERRHFRLWQTRFVLSSAGVVALAACLLVAARHQVEIRDLKERSRAINASVAVDNARRQALLAGLPPLPVAHADLRRVDLGMRALARDDATLTPALQLLSRALDDNADVVLERIDWRLDDARPAPPDGKTPVVMTIDCTLPAGLDRRGVMEAVNRFVTALGADPHWRVSVARQPFALRPDSTWRSHDGAEDAPPSFSLLLSGAAP